MAENKPLPPTITFPLPILPSISKPPRWRKHAKLLLAVSALFLWGGVTGYGLRVWLVPHGDPQAAAPPIPSPMRPEPPPGALCPGILVIEDGTVLTVANNRAAVASKQGFTTVAYGAYAVTSYAVSTDGRTGRGIAGESFRFPFIWVKGEKPPPGTLRALEFVSGRRVTAQ